MQFATELRAAGKTWPEAAAAVRHRYRVNARVAPRLARGLSQRQVAELWNQRWPDDPKAFKNISTWELWPASTGHALARHPGPARPALRVLRGRPAR
ncbi:hypothetical protein ACFQ3Z_26650 [Streptomyces nogalater]